MMILISNQSFQTEFKHNKTAMASKQKHKKLQPKKLCFNKLTDQKNRKAQAVDNLRETTMTVLRRRTKLLKRVNKSRKRSFEWMHRADKASQMPRLQRPHACSSKIQSLS